MEARQQRSKKDNIVLLEQEIKNYVNEKYGLDLDESKEEESIQNYVRKEYGLELDWESKEQRKKKVDENYEKQLKEELKKADDEKFKEEIEKELHRIHEKSEEKKSRLDPGRISPLFTNILEEDEKFDQETYNRNKRFDIYYGRIRENFASYYQNISSQIMTMPKYLDDDLNYIILQELSSMTEDTYEVDDEIFMEWEEESCPLMLPTVSTINNDKYVEKLLKKIEKLLKEKTGFPVQFKTYVDWEKNYLCLQRTNIRLQLALLFYRDFRERFTGNKKLRECDFERLFDMIENIDSIPVEEEELNDIKEIDNILFPYLMERVTGVNLCLEFAEYFNALEKHNEYNSKVEQKLLAIFRCFCKLPNVFFRIQIMRDFMDSVLLFHKELERQLIIVKNLLERINQRYQNICNDITEMIKDRAQSEKVRDEYLHVVQEKCCDIKKLKEIYGTKQEKDYIFMESSEKSKKFSKIYINLQKEYIKMFNLKL